MKRLLQLAGTSNAYGPSLAVGRTLLALAELSVLVFTRDGTLFMYLPGLPGGVQCNGVRAASLWCVADSQGHHLAIVRWFAVGILAVAASGYRPRWTCIPQWYVTFSLGATITSPNGGESAAAIATLVLIPICLGDPRRWQWTKPATEQDPSWRGAAHAAILALRLQVAVIYANAAISKLLHHGWRNGTAMFNVAHDPNFGFPPAALRALNPLLTHYWSIAALTWSIPFLEIVIAVSVVGTLHLRRLAIALVLVLHVGIIIVMGLGSFGVIMVTLLLIAYGGPASRPSGTRRLETRSAGSMAAVSVE
jgi:antimicrobial peptide system SdpB family protein